MAVTNPPGDNTGAPASPERPNEPWQSLYRRYRPQRFAEVRGQAHVSETLRKAVRDHKVAHAYLFSGPRGTGKTSTARILAMALNCAQPMDGEPDGVCASCVEIRRGASMDVHELDAASNRKLDEMRDLLSRVALGTTGRWKVYIIDEVHQLTGDAASALLKTLEEPPAHVIFVLATTDPQKVLPTIRSRTQHFEFRLLGSDVLAGLLRDVNSEAGLGVPTEAIDLVVRRGHGSARDALSVLDQVAAAGSVEDEVTVVTEVVDAIADRDPGRALLAVAEGMAAGRDPRRLLTDLLGHLRNGFLATQARSLVLLPDDAVAEVEAQAHRLGTATMVRALEVLGQAAVDMRDSVDTRITLEVAVVRLAAPAADPSPAALLARIERLEGGGMSARGGGRGGESAVPSVRSPGADQPSERKNAPSPAPPPSPRDPGANQPAEAPRPSVNPSPPRPQT
nr:DNA polymerase III subunit gamma/tau [Actinomycetota bacterium]